MTGVQTCALPIWQRAGAPSPGYREDAQLRQPTREPAITDTHARPHLAFDELVEYWLDEFDDVRTQEIDMHLLACDACGAQLDEVVTLAQGVREAFANGLVHSFLSAAFIARLAESGMRVREYLIPRNGSVNCSVTAQDEALVVRLVAPLEGVSRVDVAVRLSVKEGEVWAYDVPFDMTNGQVLVAPKISHVRKLPTHDATIRLLAVDDNGSREIAHYTLHHSGPLA